MEFRSLPALQLAAQEPVCCCVCDCTEFSDEVAFAYSYDYAAGAHCGKVLQLRRTADDSVSCAPVLALDFGTYAAQERGDAVFLATTRGAVYRHAKATGEVALLVTVCDATLSSVFTSDVSALVGCTSSAGHVAVVDAAAHGALVFTAQEPVEAYCGCFLDANVFLVGGETQNLTQYDIRGQHPSRLAHKDEFAATVVSVARLSDHLLAVGSYDDYVRVFDTRNPERALFRDYLGGGMWKLRVFGDGFICGLCGGGFAVFDKTLRSHRIFALPAPNALCYAALALRAGRAALAFSFYEREMQVYSALAE